MLKRFLSLAAALVAALTCAFAHAVDANVADEAALRALKGIGPAKARAIVEERSAGGPFRDADDLGRRVKGLGGQAVERLRAEGLTIGAAREPLATSLASSRRVPGGVRIDGGDRPPFHTPDSVVVKH
mgnify:CR=1 FL=1